MMFLVLARTPLSSVDYLLNHTNEKYLKKQILELMQLICSAGYSDVYKKIPQGKAIQNWIKASNNNEMYVYFYINYAFYLLYNDIYNFIPDNQQKIFTDYANKMDLNWDQCEANNIKTAIFRYQKQYKEYTTYDTNIELPIDICINEYRKYLKWKIEQNKDYFKKEVA